MPLPRLNAKVWTSAFIRRCEVELVTAMIVHHGDDTAGMVLVKVNTLGQGCSVYQPTSDLDGNREWLRATGPELVEEAVADDFIARQRSYDRDIWVIEVEDPKGRHFLLEPVVNT